MTRENGELVSSGCSDKRRVNREYDVLFDADWLGAPEKRCSGKRMANTVSNLTLIAFTGDGDVWLASLQVDCRIL
jgi:uncharacterized protein (AIM24 family)